MPEWITHLLTAIGAFIVTISGVWIAIKKGLVNVNKLSAKVDRDNFTFMSGHMQEAINSLTAEGRKSLEREIGHVAKIATLEAEAVYLKATIDDLRTRR